MKKFFFSYLGLIAFVFMVSLSSCKDRHLSTNTERAVDTVTIYKETVRDSLVVVPADSSAIYALLDCDSLNNVYIKEISDLQGKRSSVNFSAAAVEKGFAIQADCICDSIAITLTMIDRYRDHTVKSEVVTETIKQAPCNKAILFLRGFGLGVIVIIVFGIIIRILLKLYKTAYGSK